MGGFVEGLFSASIAILFILAYFLPFIISCANDHKNGTPIFIINLFLGWTLIGWVLALAWAASYQGKPTANNTGVVTNG